MPGWGQLQADLGIDLEDDKGTVASGHPLGWSSAFSGHDSSVGNSVGVVIFQALKKIMLIGRNKLRRQRKFRVEEGGGFVSRQHSCPARSGSEATSVCSRACLMEQVLMLGDKASAVTQVLVVTMR